MTTKLLAGTQVAIKHEHRFTKYAVLVLPLLGSLPVRPIQFFGVIGFIQLAIILMVIIFVLYVALRHQKIYVDKFVGLMALIGVIIAISSIAGRGMDDGYRLKVWVGASLCYFLTLNLTINTEDVRPLLFISAFITISFIALDLVSHAVQYDLADPYQLNLFRALGTSIGVAEDTVAGGQSNYVANIAFMFSPIILSFALFERGLYRITSIVLIVICVGLALLISSRSFFLIFAVCMVGLVTVIDIPRKKIIQVALVLIGLFVFFSEVSPNMLFSILARISGTFDGDPRTTLWSDTFEAASDAWLFGHGAIGPSRTRSLYRIITGHNLLLQVLFEYGLVMIIPALFFLSCWFQQTWMLMKRSRHAASHIRSSSIASFLVILAVLVYSTLTIALFFETTYACLAFMLLAISSVQKRQLDASISVTP